MRKKAYSLSRYKVPNGFSLIEMLVAVFVFALLGAVTVQALSSSLKNSRKSDQTGFVREDVDHALSSIERLLRNAQTITCPAGNSNRLDYTDEYETTVPTTPYFECTGSPTYIASSGARLTSARTRIICSPTVTVFSCTPATAGVPASVTITLSGQDAASAGSEGAVVTEQTRIQLRTY